MINDGLWVPIKTSPMWHLSALLSATHCSGSWGVSLWGLAIPHALSVVWEEKSYLIVLSEKVFVFLCAGTIMQVQRKSHSVY